MKNYQYGYKTSESDFIRFDYIEATSFDNALKKAKQHLKEYYGSDFKIVYLSE